MPRRLACTREFCLEVAHHDIVFAADRDLPLLELMSPARLDAAAVADGTTRGVRDTARVLVGACAVLVAASLAFRVALLQVRAFDPDEFQHAHAAWAVSHGMLPFRDFFEHHMPAFAYLAAPVLARFDVERSADDAIRALVAARAAMWGFAACVIVLTILIGARYRGPAVGWLSGALVSTSVVFVGRSMEIRPDTPALACWLASVLALALGLRAGHGRQLRWFTAAGTCFGIGLLLNLKLLFAVPGIASGAILWLLTAPSHARTRRVASVASFIGGSALPASVTAIYFLAHGAAGDLVHSVLTNNAAWAREVSARSTLKWMLLRDPFLCAASVAGLGHALARLVRERDAVAGLLVLPSASLLAGLAIIPAPYPQYMLMIIPLGAVLGAHFAWWCLTELPRAGVAPGAARRLEAALVMSTFIAIAALGIAVARPFFLNRAMYPLLGVAGVLTAAAFASRRSPHRAAAALVLIASVYSAQQLLWMYGLSNTATLQQIRYVHAVTRPHDTVLDGFSGLAWFRRHAGFYPFLHGGVRARLTADDTDAILGLLTACKDRPRVVLLDEHLLAVSPAVGPLVLQNYERGVFPRIWLAREPSIRCSGSRAGSAERAAGKVSHASDKRLPD